MSTANHEGFPFQPGAAPEDPAVDAEPAPDETEEEKPKRKRKPKQTDE